MRSERLASAIGFTLIALVACQKSPKTADSGIETPTTTTTTSSSTPIGPSAPGQRTERATKVVSKCAVAPPKDCASDADCALIDIPTNDGPCASTLRVGVSADKKAVASASCATAGDHRSGPPCVVHWVRAEEGPDTPPSGTEIAARCMKPSASAPGVCMSRYVAATP